MKRDPARKHSGRRGTSRSLDTNATAKNRRRSSKVRQGDVLKLAFRNLFQHRARNALMVFSLVLTMGLITFVLAARAHAANLYAYMEGRNNMLVGGKDGLMPLSRENELLAIKGIKRTIPIVPMPGTVKGTSIRFPVQGTTAAYTTISSTWFYVDPEGVARWETEKNGAILGRQTARELNMKVGSSLIIDTESGPLEVVVSAISSKGHKSTGALVHREYLEKRFDLPGQVAIFWTELDLSTDVRSIAQDVDAMFKNTPHPTSSISASAALSTSIEAARVIPSLLTGAGMLILLATLLVTANTVSITLRERTAELAVLRAIGFRRSRILRLLFTEVLLVGLTAGFIGSALPVLLFRNGVKMGSVINGQVELPPQLVGYAMLTSAAVAFFAALIPAIQVSRLDVVAALRQV